LKPPTILLADDHSLILKGIQGVLERHYDVVGSLEDGRALLRAAERLRPDFVILDISMPILNGIDAAYELRKMLPSVRVIFLTMHSTAIYLRKALAAGASGYVLKSAAAEELVAAIEEARRGRTYISPGLSQSKMDAPLPAADSKLATELTGRQKQVLQLVAEGRQSKEIAELMHVSLKTVEFHRSRLMSRLGVRSVAELTRFAIQEGLVPPEQ